ncbi:MAG: hypothetical protein V4660_14740 [Pseudomonadota bacterium]
MQDISSQHDANNGDESLAESLVNFYDEFVEVQAYSAFLCDALSCMVSTQLEMDDATARGVCIFSSYVKRRLEELKTRLKQIQQRACRDN